MKKNRRKWTGCLLLTAVLLAVLTIPALADVDILKGIESGKNELLKGIKSVADIVVSVLLAADVIVLLFNIFAFVRHRNDGDSHQPQITAILITIAVAILLGSWYVWGAVMMGTGTQAAVPAWGVIR